MMSTPPSRLPLPQQGGLSGLLSQLSVHLENATPDAVEQEMRHALKSVAADISLDDATLAVFEVEPGVLHRPKLLATSETDETVVAQLAVEPWILEKAGALEPILLTTRFGETAALPAATLRELRDAGIRVVIATSWKTAEDTVAAAILCFRGGREDVEIFSRNRPSFIEFTSRVGALLLGSRPLRQPMPPTAGACGSVSQSAAAGPPRSLRRTKKTDWSAKASRGAM